MQLLNLIFLIALLQGCGSKSALTLPETPPPPTLIQPVPSVPNQN